ncbi:MAG: hypothetical protein N2Z79_00070 [Candidatus Omnitrophica bacterium]|nr:hypothetical protein [Candidatus Omnitrophota bacterium]
MPTIRDLFHSLANTFNKISIASGVNRDLLECEPLESLSNEKLKERSEELIKILKNIERYVIEADQVLGKIKEIVYNSINPDKEI